MHADIAPLPPLLLFAWRGGLLASEPFAALPAASSSLLAAARLLSAVLPLFADILLSAVRLLAAVLLLSVSLLLSTVLPAPFSRHLFSGRFPGQGGLPDRGHRITVAEGSRAGRNFRVRGVAMSRVPSDGMVVEAEIGRWVPSDFWPNRIENMPDAIQGSPHAASMGRSPRRNRTRAAVLRVCCRSRPTTFFLCTL